MPDCTIIGAGISGLLAAKILTDSGLTVQVIEKSRGVGGRMATRRRDTAVFDHGAQFFTVRDKRFEHWVDQWSAAGLVQPWYDLPDSGQHYRAVPSMTGIAKHLSGSLEVAREVTVDRASYDSHWTITSTDQQQWQSAALILTAPLPQSLAILDRGETRLPEPARTKLESIDYHRCIVAMAILDRPSPISANNGALRLDGEPIQWIADNQRKGISPDATSITIHSTPAFAEDYWDSPNAERVPLLLDAAAEHLGDARVLAQDGHRWGFSQPTSAFWEEAYVDPQLPLAIAGDGLAGGRIEGAAISGIVAAQSIRSTLGH